MKKLMLILIMFVGSVSFVSADPIMSSGHKLSEYVYHLKAICGVDKNAIFKMNISFRKEGDSLIRIVKNKVNGDQFHKLINYTNEYDFVSTVTSKEKDGFVITTKLKNPSATKTFKFYFYEGDAGTMTHTHTLSDNVFQGIDDNDYEETLPCLIGTGV